MSLSDDKAKENITLTQCRQQIALPLEERNRAELRRHFFLAAENNWPNVIDYLLDNQALDVNSRADDESDMGRWTALILAAQHGWIAAVEVLLKHDADVNLTRNDGTTPLISAIRNGHPEIVNILLENKKAKVNLDQKTNLGVPPLIMAVQKSDAITVDILLRHGANVNSTIDKPPLTGWTALVVATQMQYETIIQRLLKQEGILINPPIENGITVLLLACTSNMAEITELFLKQPAIVKDIPYPKGKSTIILDLEHEKWNAERVQLKIQTLKMKKNLVAVYIFWKESISEQYVQAFAAGLHDHPSLMILKTVYKSKPSYETTHAILDANSLLRCNHINGTQQNIIEGTISFYLNNITTAFKDDPKNAILAFNAMMSENVSEETRNLLTNAEDDTKNVWEDTVLAIRGFLAHPYPQNRRMGNPAFGEEGDDGVRMIDEVPTVFWETNGEEQHEPQGIFGLNTQNVEFEHSVTREAVVKTIHDLIKAEIINQERILKLKKAPPPPIVHSTQKKPPPPPPKPASPSGP